MAVSEPRLRLMCLPDVGEGSDAYRDLADCLPGDIELLAAELPGRGLRRGETPTSDLSQITEGLGRAIRDLSEDAVPFVLLGRGLGAALACRVTVSFQEQEHPMPIRLMLGNLDLESPSLRLRTAGDTLRVLSASKGYDDCLHRVDHGDVGLATVRSDLWCLQTWLTHRTPVDVPLSVFVDPSQTHEDVSRLGMLSSEGFDVSRVPGGLRVLGGEPLRRALAFELNRTGAPAACRHHVA